MNIEIIRSKRKTISIEIKRDARIIVRSPKKMKQSDIDKFITDKTPWIEKHINRIKSNQEPKLPITDEEIKFLTEQAREIIPYKVDIISRLMLVSYGKITIRHQVSRWGSCSSKGNLNFNCLLMLCPDEVVNYVIIHELCHLKHLNHSKEFWAMVELYCPDYKIHRKWLKDNGSKLIGRSRANSD